MFAQFAPGLAQEVVKDRVRAADQHRAARRTTETRRPVRPTKEW